MLFVPHVHVDVYTCINVYNKSKQNIPDYNYERIWNNMIILYVC